MTNASQDAATPLPMTIFRSLTGVLVGLIVAVGSAFVFYRIAFAILLKMNDQIFVDFPTGFWVATLGYDLVAGLLGGLTAAWIAGRRPALHGVLVGIALVALTAWTWQTTATGEEPKWFFPGAMLVGLLGAAAGGALRAGLARRSRASPEAPSAN